MKSTIFWDITPCSRALLAICFHAGFLLSFDPKKAGALLPKRRLAFNGLHGVIPQKTMLFITTAVRL
jgi:hypothetical protein